MIDDDAALRIALKLVLEYDDREVAVAKDGDEALAVMDDFPPDIIVMDWRLPGLSGVRLCCEIRRRQTTVPIVVVSSADEAFETAAPVSARLRKPVDVAHLRRIIAGELHHVNGDC